MTCAPLMPRSPSSATLLTPFRQYIPFYRLVLKGLLPVVVAIPSSKSLISVCLVPDFTTRQTSTLALQKESLAQDSVNI